MTFVGSRRKALLVLLISACFVAIGVWMASERPFIGWLTIAFFGLGIAVSLVMLLPNATYLRLDEDGFEMGSFFRKERFRWTDVDDFQIDARAGTRMIAIVFNPEFKQKQLARAVAASLAGIEAAIPDHYNASLEEVREALTTWKQRHGREGAAPAIGWHTGGGFPWRLLLLKLGALLSFCGGPLVLADELKLRMDKDLAFALAFLPTLALVFGAYSLWTGERDRWDKTMVLFGGLGAVALMATNALAIAELAAVPDRADAGLIKVGIAVGTVFAVYYAYAAHRFFRSPPLAA